MTAAPQAPAPDRATDPADLLLHAVAANLDAVIQAEVRQFQTAVWWAELHPGDEVDTTVAWADRELEVAGDGAPTVAEFAIADFALASGLSTDAGRTYLGDAVEICHRLPLLWERVLSGEVRVWKARRVAQSTRSLSPDAAAYVDRHVAPVARSCSYAQIEREVDAARATYDPAAVEADRLAAANQQHFRIHSKELTTNGLVHVDGLIDLPAALALESAISARAHALLDTDPLLPLDQRRAIAAGLLADDALTGGVGSPKELVLYAHLDGSGIADVDNTRSVVTVDEVAQWCRSAGTKVTIRPVIDLAAELHHDGYEPTPAQHEQAILTNPTCVFPGCSRQSRGCDLDHVEAWPLGPTTSTNLAPLCRGHHRLKTHGGWTYQRTGPTTFRWTSPTGRRYDGGNPPRRHLR